jgi:2,3-bisphosphoglycerate-independent phosphoglycerate mutase
VPLLLAGGAFASDGSTSYGEHACADGSLGELLGMEVLPAVSRVLR